MQVRAMRAEELDAAVGVWLAANVARDKQPDAARSARVREKLGAATAAVLVAVVDGDVVGLVLAEPGRLGDGTGPLDTALVHVSMVFTHPAAQGRGVGVALLRRLFTDAAARGVLRVSLWTGTENIPARRLYERVGMVATRTRRDVGWVRYEREL